MKIALVLAGGAARGFCHIGVLQGLEERGIVPSMIVGTSMGALLGSIYAANPDANKLYNEAKKYNLYRLIELRDFLVRGGMIGGTKYEKIMNEYVGDIEFSELKIPLAVNATNFLDGSTKVFTKGKVKDAVRASISVPIIFKPVREADDVFVDGGLTDNLFFNYLIPKAKEFDKIILVNLNSKVYKLKKDFSYTDMIIQNIYIMQKNQVDMKLKLLDYDRSKEAMMFKKKLVIINPDVSDLNGTQFGKFEIFVKRGYDAFKKEFR